MGQDNTLVNKFSLLLCKVKDALVQDLQQEFVLIREAAARLDGQSQEADLADYFDGVCGIVDSVFARVGYDISHYDGLNDLKDLVTRLVNEVEDLGTCIDDSMKAFSEEEGETGIKVANMLDKVVPRIVSIVQLTKSFSELEWKQVEKDLVDTAEGAGKSLKEQFLNKDFARRVLDHILVTLMRHAKDVFKDEIEFVRMSVQQQVDALTKEVDNIEDAISEHVRKVLDQIGADEIKDVLQESLREAGRLYEKVDRQLSEEFGDAYRRLSHGLSVTYSILDFLGILKEKQINLTLPGNIKQLLDDAQSAIRETESKINSTAQDICESTQEAISTVQDKLKITQEVTGIRLASVSTIDIQLKSLDISGVLEGKLQSIRSFSYPVRLTIFDWEGVTKLFTDPVNHFRKLYPVKTVDDAEQLVRRIMGILHNINPDIPDYNSLKKLLEDLLGKLEGRLIQLVNELKTKSKDLALEVWKEFQPLITTIRKVIDMLREMALEIKENISDVLDEVKDAATEIARTARNQIDELGKELYAQAKEAAGDLKDTAGNIENIIKEIDRESDKLAQSIKDGLRDLSQEAGNVAHQAENVVHQAENAAGEIKEIAAIFHLPSFDIPSIIRDAITEPLVEAADKTFGEARIEIDLKPFLEVSKEYGNLKACIGRLGKDARRLEKHILDTPSRAAKITGAAGSLDITALSGKLTDIQTTFTAFPDICEIVRDEAIQPLQIWAYGVLKSIRTVTDAELWESRMDSLFKKLKAEFNSDLSNISGLISKKGAMKLFNGSSATGKALLNSLNINDYITIILTAAEDIMLPDPEYYCISFRNCLQEIFTNFTSRILEEYSSLRDKAARFLKEKEKALNDFSSQVESIAGSVETDIKTMGDELDRYTTSVLERIRESAAQARKLIEKINAALNSIKEIPADLSSQITTGAETLLNNLATAYAEKMEDLVDEIWRVLKSRMINPLISSISNVLMDCIKAIFRNVLRRIVGELTAVRDDASQALESMTDRLPVLKDLHEAISDYVHRLQAVIDGSRNIAKELDTIIPGGKITDLKQVPQVLEAIAEDKAISQELEKISIKLSINGGQGHVEIPYYYVNMAQSMFNATLDFIQSDMSMKEIFVLLTALYRGIPEQVKERVYDLLPDMPDLPDNALTDLMGDVKGTYDIDNRMCNVTLLDLKSGKKKNQENDVNYSLSLQLFMFAGQYTLDEVEEEAEDEEEAEEGVPAIYFLVSLKGDLTAIFKVGENHYFELAFAGKAGEQIGEDKILSDKSTGFCLTAKDPEKGVTSMFHGLGSLKGLEGALMARFSRNDGKETAEKAGPARLLSTRYLDINVGNYPQTLYLLFNSEYPEDVAKVLNLQKEQRGIDGFTAGYLTRLEDVEFILKLRQNSFFKKVLKDDISAQFSLSLLFDYLKGFSMDGGYRFHLDLDCSGLKLGSMKLSQIGIDLGSADNDWGTLDLGMGTSFSADFSAVSFSFENMGVGMSLNVVKPDFSLGDWDFGINFRFPEGIGISIDTSAIKGSGLIAFKVETGELFGSLELDVIDKFGVSALLMADLGTVDGHSFNLMAMISTNFSPGIPLGMGFSLTAVGGVLGLQRMLDAKAITQAVRQGTLESVFFVNDLGSHLGEMKSTCEKVFPAKDGQFFFGLLARISFEPVVNCSFGLLMQMPDPAEAIIVGALKVGLKAMDIVRINVYFAGGINFRKGIWFDASIIDSWIVGIKLEGDMAFRLFWGGDTKGFLLSIGGFHPAYKPEEGMVVSDMKRLAMKLDYNILKIGLDTYLAVTSNTFQIGAHLDLKIGWDGFGITGYAGFDALFQFDPFMFIFGIEAGVAVRCGSWTLMSIDLALELSGPAPWNANGKAKFHFLLIPVSVHFNITWGDDRPQLPEKTIAVMSLLRKEIENPCNWMQGNDSNKDTEVNIRNSEAESTLTVSPIGSLSFNQSIVPLENRDLDMCDNAVPTDYSTLVIKYIVTEGDRKDLDDDEYEFNDFAPALYYRMTNKDKLSSPSYKSMRSGFKDNSKDYIQEGRCQIHEIHIKEITIGCFSTTDETTEKHGNDLGGALRKVKTAKEASVARNGYDKNSKTGFNRYREMLDKLN